jgi:hypothetical protein
MTGYHAMKLLRTVAFGGITLDVPEGWGEVTDQLEGSDTPFTLAKLGENSGALQFSPALYKKGTPPSTSPTALLEMVRTFGEQRGLGKASHESAENGAVSLAGGTFRVQDDFVRVWYGSDGRNIVLMTYVTEWGNQRIYLPECEAMVRTVRFQ